MLKLVVALLCTVVVCALPGGWSDVEVDDEYVAKAANHAANMLNTRFRSPYHSKLYKIITAKSQVVAGKNYDLQIIVGLTECLKTEVYYDEVESCEFQEGEGMYLKCDVRVYEDLKGTHKLVSSSGCIFATKDELY